MDIKNIKINAYGNLENKEINLDKKINIIHGANESGKSTMLSYIVNSFYGISKTKDGKDISDYDKYKPWNNNEFSGRISYELDNGEQYEVFRDFNKKNPKIYNKNLEDITDKFEIDKKEGSKFFLEQTGIDKQMYTSTVVSMQDEVRLDDKNQNMLIQKIANLAGTGEDNVSYKKALTKLQNKIRDEIGTNKTSQKPINILNNQIEEINKKIEEIKPNINKKYEIDNQKDLINENLKNLEIKKEILEEINKKNQNKLDYLKEKNIKEISKKDNEGHIEKLKKEANTVKEEQMKVEKTVNNLNKKIEEKKVEQSRIEQELNKENEQTENIENSKNIKSSKNTIYIIFLIVFIALGILGVALFKNYLVTIVFGILALIDIILLITKKIKVNRIIKEENKLSETKKKEHIRDLEEEKEYILKEIDKISKELKEEEANQKEIASKNSMLQGQIILLEKTNTSLENELNSIKEKLEKLQSNNEEELLAQYNGKMDREKLLQIINSTDIEPQLKNVETQINNEKIKLKGLEIEENTVIPQIDAMVELEETLQAKKEEYNNLKNQEDIINITIENLEQAYEEMKTTITPKFTENLSKNIEEISNGKYSKVTINDESGMVVENNRGEYINANNLSTGTIDQLYLSLRLSMIEDLSKESLPIILDETFAYFDNTRLENAIKYLIKLTQGENIKNHQVIIFTCTNREKEILEKLDFKYNLVEI